MPRLMNTISFLTLGKVASFEDLSAVVCAWMAGLNQCSTIYRIECIQPLQLHHWPYTYISAESLQKCIR
jgi:hypothetical protein